MAWGELVLQEIQVKTMEGGEKIKPTSGDFRLVIGGGLVSSFIRTTLDSSLPLFPNPVFTGRGKVRSYTPLARSAVVAFLAS